MALKILERIFGDYSAKVVKRHQRTVALINSLEPEMQKLSDAELAHKTVEFKERIARGETLEQILPEAFAVVREASIRTTGRRPFDVQLIGGIVLHEGNIAEMKTGEGKTLVAAMPLYLNALLGRGCHLVTVNDYLAKVGRDDIGRIYRFLGMSCGLIVHGLTSAQRREAYNCDITYGTNNEFGFDYLRDNMAMHPQDMVHREFFYAIVDEADSILIDEARTPLIISGPSGKPAEMYYTFAKIAERLKRDEDYIVEEKEKRVAPTEEGIAKVEKWLNVDHLYEGENQQLVHYLNNAIKAKELFHRDRDYVVKDGQVIIVDEFTGRLMFGRRWSDGLHQAVEAKEGVKIEEETQTLATITFQNYFRMYKKLAGMTGTALTEEEEFRKIYGLDVIAIPTNKPMIRIDHPDVVYKTVKAKFKAVADDVEERHKRGQPVLVGTVSIEKSEYLSQILTRRGIPHQVLNAKHHEREAEIVAQAGRFGAVTIATNMAGRGTDILLGGNPDFAARQRMRAEGYAPELIVAATDIIPSQDPEVQAAREVYLQYLKEEEAKCAEEAEKVRAVGGLCVIGTERHEARRIDNQLRGRAGRQGDPGESRFYVSLEDDLMRLFGGEMVQNLMNKLGIEDDVPIDSPMVSRAIENAQKKVEARNFDIRKHVLQYDDVMNTQRELIYKQRRQILEGHDTREVVLDAIAATAQSIVEEGVPEDVYFEEWDPSILVALAEDNGIPKGAVNVEDLKAAVEGVRREQEGREKLAKVIEQAAIRAYEEKEARLGAETMRQLERFLLLRTVDEKWMDHLDAMDDLREGVGLRAYGQRDPLIEYKMEAMEMFNNMIRSIQRDMVRNLFIFEVVREPQRPRIMIESGSQGAAPRQPVRAEGKKVGRNDPCPCGSGKKYKFCCGRAANA
ncbi:preprotein translocase subunit SecA [Symbiobacterium thermophilum]|uniref:Protein translocase subunit SecA n=2 Tax=Symbiobacterium thermophilum TaxID=2734 RepID=SECA_SYMTH|nr:preprotein translocase subunit SecA [Symbiobacterium thermophilum]Q67T83.1 RecName: Full=Protein translocase subunit SecA [Symbiobacterium thermophilum IAM 14863]MBY6276273.1 protein translocase subunit SecA [Symbiobacterium thermophilum]BAD39110.1 preprotein translocase subunit SecA [Symbiobacterium thermophilum IAM 14863]